MKELTVFKEKKDNLIQLLKEAVNLYDGQDADKVENFKSLIKSIEESDFSIVIVGEFSAGKSTFLNALMGEKLLPSFSSETTATINYLKHISKVNGDHTLEIKYKDPNKPNKYTQATTEEIEKNVSTRGKNVVSEIDNVTLYLNSPLLENGITLVDSPGLNGTEGGHAEVTENQIEKSHACVYMFSAPKPGAKTDFETLSNLINQFDNIFLVLTQIDVIKTTEESVESVVGRLVDNYKKQFPDNTIPEIYPISGYNALVARSERHLEIPYNFDYSEDSRKNLLEKSRIKDFEDRLWRFITQGEKTIQELLSPALTINSALDNEIQSINEKLELLNNKEPRDFEAEKQDIINNIEKINQEIQASEKELENDIEEVMSDIKDELMNNVEMLRVNLEKKIRNFNDLDTIEHQIKRTNKSVENELFKFQSTFDDKVTQGLRQLLIRKYDTINNKHLKQFIRFDNNKIEIKQFSADSDININLEKYEQEKKEIDNQILAYSKQYNEATLSRIQAMKVQSEIDRLREEKNRLNEEKFNMLNILGAKPKVEYRQEERVEYEKRSGVFGVIGNVFVGHKRRVYTDTIKDDTEVKIYDERQEQLKNEIQQSISEIEEQRRALESNHQDPEYYEIQKQTIEHEQQQLEDKRRQYIAEYGEKITQQQKKVLNNIIEEYNDYIDELEFSISTKLNDEIENRKENLAQGMLKVLKEQFEDQTNKEQNKLEQLNNLVNSEEVEKNKTIIELNEKEQSIQTLKLKVEQYINEINTIKPDVIERR